MKKSNLIKRFGADGERQDKLNSLKTWQYIGIVFGIFCFILMILFSSLEDDYYEYEKSAREMYSMLKWVCGGIGLLEIICSPIILYSYSKSEAVLAETFLAVYDDHVEGLSFNNVNSGISKFFSVTYDDIADIYISVADESITGINLKIHTTNDIYKCCAIENNGEAADLIREQKAIYEQSLETQENILKETKPCEATDTSTTFENLDTSITTENIQNKFCIYCGEELKNEALFCNKCGKKCE